MRPGASASGVADRRGVSRSPLFECGRQAREGTLPVAILAKSEVPPSLVPVRLVEDPPRPQAGTSSRPERPARSIATIELVLRNGRMLRVSEAIGPEVLGRLPAALDA
jgi:transposase